MIVSVSGKPESHRITKLRGELVAQIGGGLDPAKHSLGDLVRRYLVGARRLIAPAKRRVSMAKVFWDGELVSRHLDKVAGLVRLIEEGADLNSYLSIRAHRPGQHPRDHQHDGDFALAAYDVHHLHFDPINPAGSRRVRRGVNEDVLLFAIFGAADALLIMVGTHKSFFDGSLEAAVVGARVETGHWVLGGISGDERLTSLQRTRLGLRGVNSTASVDGLAVMSAAVMCNGGSMRTLYMADFAAHRINEVDPILDDPRRARDWLGPAVPADPRFSWHFDYARLVLVEETTRTGFTFSDMLW